MLELPEFKLLKRQPDAPHVAHVVARRDVPNEYGTLITYEVRQGRSRNSRDWWISASRQGLRMSNTLHTTKQAKADAWIRAVETGQICVGCVTKKSAAQLDQEVKDVLAKLDEKRKSRGWS
jgi:hypothetical protein